MNKIGIYDEYLIRGNEAKIWSAIIKLGDKINNEPYFEEFALVMNVIMERVVNNFFIIKSELSEAGYVFENLGNINLDYNVFEKNNVSNLSDVSRIDDFFSDYGCIPHSLSFFYKHIKSIDFRGYFSEWKNPYFLDAIYLFPISGLLEINESPTIIDEGSESHVCVLISPNEYVKENVSGDGLEYAIELSKPRKLPDSRVFGCPGKIPFIDYLRLCFKWGGLAGLALFDEEEIPRPILRTLKSIREQMLPI